MTGERPKRILAATLGLAPQVLTETLYALHHARPRFSPDEIHILSTSAGAEKAARSLLGPQGMLAQFAREHDAPHLAEALTPERLHLIRDAQGAPLADIASAAQNRRAADQIADLIRRLTADPETTLHVSIAGGRKTMGFLLGYALSLYGRPQDRLTHVLVDERLEGLPDFWWPPADGRVVKDREGRPIAPPLRVSLAEIPFVRLREGLPEALISGAASYGETVAAAQELWDPPSLRIDLEGGLMECHGRRLRPGDAELAFAALLAQRLIAGAPHGGALHWTEFDPAAYLRFYERTPAPIERTRAALRDAAGLEDWFAQRKTRLRGALQASLGKALTEIYAPRAIGRRPSTRVGFALPPEAVSFEMLD